MNRLLIAMVSLTLCGCGITIPATRSETKLQSLDLGMDRHQVREVLGEPSSVRGAKKLEDGSQLKVDEYRLYRSGTSAKHFGLGILLLTLPWWIPFDQPSPYWVQYVDGKLDRWGKAGDWTPTVSGDLTIRNK